MKLHALALIVSAMLVLSGCSTSPASVTPGRAALDGAVSAVYPALVQVHVVMTSSEDGRMRKSRGSGSGAIVSADGYVVTNHHVAGRGTRIYCRLADRQEIDAVLVGTDPMSDIAVLQLKLDQLKDRSRPLPVARWGNSDKLRVGDTVLAMGSPAGLSQSVTVGVVSNTEMVSPNGAGLTMEGEVVGQIVRWIGHDAQIWHGNSGGPLVNLSGQIIGINEIGIGGIGGAIPANLARSVYEEIVRNRDGSTGRGRVNRSWTGIEPQPMLKCSAEPLGVLVGGVSAGSPAQDAGLKCGDVITQFDGQSVRACVPEELPLFNQLVLSRPIGKTVPVVAYRDGKRIDLKLTTVAREPAMGEDRELKSWGMTARNLTRTQAAELRRADRNGVLVDSVRKGSPCSEAKPAIVAGDIIVSIAGHGVASVEGLRSQTAKFAGDGSPTPLLVEFERGGQKLLTVVKVGKEDDKEPPVAARKAYLGVQTQVLTAELVKALNLGAMTGVRITNVLPGTTAEQAGLKVGDVIIRLDNDPIPAKGVEHEALFAEMIRRRDIDQKIALEVIRDGKPAGKIEVTLQAPPTPVSELKKYRNEEFEFTARAMSFADCSERKLENRTTGILIDQVEPAGWAALGGLRVDDVLLQVDGQEISDIDALEQTLAKAKTSKARQLVFLVRRGVRTRYLELSPAWE